MDHALLAIHLNDHLGGSRAGLELARRMSRTNRGTPFGDDLGRIAREIEEDRRDLERIMEHSTVPRSRAKEAAGWLAERLGRLKPNGRLLGPSPLGRLVELEALIGGITLKRSLWETLSIVWRQDDATPPGVDLDRLRKRADEQLGALEGHREAVVLAALRGG